MLSLCIIRPSHLHLLKNGCSFGYCSSRRNTHFSYTHSIAEYPWLLRDGMGKRCIRQNPTWIFNRGARARFPLVDLDVPHPSTFALVVAAAAVVMDGELCSPLSHRLPRLPRIHIFGAEQDAPNAALYWKTRPGSVLIETGIWLSPVLSSFLPGQQIYVRRMIRCGSVPATERKRYRITEGSG